MMWLSKWMPAAVVLAAAGALTLARVQTISGQPEPPAGVPSDIQPVAALGQPEELTLDSVPPVVVKTLPEAGDVEVDADLKEIRVKFSQDMEDGSWSWSMLSKESFPETTGKPKYLDDKRTCVLPVKLKPGKTYAIWLNSQKLGNFKSASGDKLPAVPYLLVFRTKR